MAGPPWRRRLLVSLACLGRQEEQKKKGQEKVREILPPNSFNSKYSACHGAYFVVSLSEPQPRQLRSVKIQARASNLILQNSFPLAKRFWK
jgi:Rieske Fe-S protein